MKKSLLSKDWTLAALVIFVSVNALAQSKDPNIVYCENQTKALEKTILNPVTKAGVETELQRLDSSIDNSFARVTLKIPTYLQSELVTGPKARFNDSFLPVLSDFTKNAATDLAFQTLGQGTKCDVTEMDTLEFQGFNASCEKQDKSISPSYARPTAMGDAWVHGVSAELYSYHRSLELCAITSTVTEFGEHFKISLASKSCETKSFIPNYSPYPGLGKRRAFYAVIEGSDLEKPIILGQVPSDWNLDVVSTLVSIPANFERTCRAWQAEKYRRKIIGN